MPPDANAPPPSGAPPKDAPPEPVRYRSKVCEHCQPLRHETNVLVLARLNLLHRLADINLSLALAAILYFAVSVVLLIVVLYPVQHLVDGGTFHLLDFSSNFLFSIVEVTQQRHMTSSYPGA